jgi:hypothetical protein
MPPNLNYGMGAREWRNITGERKIKGDHLLRMTTRFLDLFCTLGNF